MKNTLTVGAALLLTTGMAHAGGLDRSGQPVGIIFEEGSYGELSFGYVMPEVSGELEVAPSTFLGSGNIGVDYLQFGAGFKNDLNAQTSYALIIDQPFGADVAYTDTDPGYPLSTTEAQFRSLGVTLLGRYKFDENLSVHGGVRSVTIGADSYVAAQTTMGAFIHDAAYDNDTAFAAVIGAAYEVPEIALRVALTYTGEMDFSHDTTYTLSQGMTVDTAVPVISDAEDTTTYTIPQSVNLDFQTGVAADTLVFGSVRWVEWTKTEINSPNYPNNPIVSYDNDTFTYNLGIGRRFSDTFSGSLSVGYEKENGGTAQDLAPTDGNLSVSLGGAYSVDDNVEISGGVRFITVGDTTTGIGAEFTDNSAVALGLRVGYSF